MPTTDRCIIPGCNRKRHRRGLCQQCLADARVQISKKRTTERRLVDGGLMLPREKRGRKPVNPFAKAAAKLAAMVTGSKKKTA